MPRISTPASDTALALALARDAFASNRIRIVRDDLTGYSHMVATRKGLFAINQSGHALIAHGLFYGMTVTADAIYLFEACDLPRVRTQRGRIVKIVRRGDRLDAASVLASDLDNACHQIDFVGPDLCVLDTAHQRAILIAPDGSRRSHQLAPETFGETPYVHVNSVLAIGDHILAIFHNGWLRPERPSELVVFDLDWRIVERQFVNGEWCHGLARLEDGTILSCGSRAGELIGSDGMRLALTKMMTRGLSVGPERIVVGCSARVDRTQRVEAHGMAIFLDRAYRVVGEITLPGAPTEIRSLQGPDYGQARDVVGLTLATAITAAWWPA